MRALLSLLVFGVSLGWAQPMDPAASACAGQSEGAACDVSGQMGTCQPAECCTGIEPDLVCSACLQCAAPSTPRPEADGGMAPAEDEVEGCATVPGTGSDWALLLSVGLWGMSRRRRRPV